MPADELTERSGGQVFEAPTADAWLELACDESGFTGGNLTFRHGVFSHASLHIPDWVAQGEMHRLERHTAARGELKAGWLLRRGERADLHQLLGPSSPLHGRIRVHLTDTRLFLLLRLADVLLAGEDVSGLDLPGLEAAASGPARVLHQNGEDAFGPQRWQAFLVSAGNLLRTNSRWVPATVVEDFEHTIRGLVASPSPSSMGDALRLLSSAAGRARTIRQALEEDPRSPPLLEPLLPALTRAVLGWGANHPNLRVVHDEQSALTPWRVAEIAHRLAREQTGHVLDLVRVDSRTDPRVQLADLVAGIARRAAIGLLSGRPDAELLDLVRPVVDPLSVWVDDFWSGRHRTVLSA